MESLPETQLEAIRQFSCPETSHAFLVSMRWNGNVTCPRCKSDKVGCFSGKRKVANCKSCKKQFTSKVGTIFEDSALPLTKWLPAMWLIVNAKNGISSCELARSLGVTQKTAWHMGHRIRLAVQQGSIEKFKGEVEVDEAFVGGSSKNKHEWILKKKGAKPGREDMTPVHGMLQRSKEKGESKVSAKVILGRKTAKTLIGNIKAQVEPKESVYTDSLMAYKSLGKDYWHFVVNHSEKKYVSGRVHTNGIENFWSLLKRCIKGTYICPRPFHLHRYLDEQVYRFNDRKMTDGERFVKAVSSVTGKRLTYKSLINKPVYPGIF